MMLCSDNVTNVKRFSNLVSNIIETERYTIELALRKSVKLGTATYCYANTPQHAKH